MAFSLRGVLNAASRGVVGGLEGDLARRDRARREQLDAEDRKRRADADALQRQFLTMRMEDLQEARGDREVARNAAADAAELAGLEQNREEARANELANWYQQRFGEEAIPTGLHPSIAIQEGERLQTEADAEAATDRRIREGSTRGGGLQLRPMVDPQTGRSVYGQFDPQAGTLTPTDNEVPSPPSQSEGQAAGFAEFLGEDGQESVFEAVTGPPSRFEQIAGSRGLRELLDAERQQFNLVGQAYAEAWLRMTTGAAYNETEFKNAFDLFVPQPGDRPATLEYKRQNRARLRAMLNTRSGRARPRDAAPEPAGTGNAGKIDAALGGT